jgi:hypothetical protein
MAEVRGSSIVVEALVERFVTRNCRGFSLKI